MSAVSHNTFSTDTSNGSKKPAAARPKKPRQPPPTVPDADRAAFLASLQVDDAQIAAWEAIDQRTPEWHAVKKHRVGGSTAGAIIGHCNIKTMDQTIYDMLWGNNDSNWQMQKGTILEDTAFRVAQVEIIRQLEAEGYRHVWLEATGIRVCKEEPWMAVSSDGKVYATGHPTKPNGLIGVIEIKCPGDDAPYIKPKEQHVDQFTMTAAIHGVSRIWYIIYTPVSTTVYTYATDMDYWQNKMLPLLRAFYMDEYLPRAVLMQQGKLEKPKRKPSKNDDDDAESSNDNGLVDNGGHNQANAQLEEMTNAIRAQQPMGAPVRKITAATVTSTRLTHPKAFLRPSVLLPPKKCASIDDDTIDLAPTEEIQQQRDREKSHVSNPGTPSGSSSTTSSSVPSGSRTITDTQQPPRTVITFGKRKIPVEENTDDSTFKSMNQFTEWKRPRSGARQ